MLIVKNFCRFHTVKQITKNVQGIDTSGRQFIAAPPPAAQTAQTALGPPRVVCVQTALYTFLMV